MRYLYTLLLLLAPLLLSAEGWRVLFVGDSITDGGWGRSGGSMASAEERNQRDLNHLYGHSFMLFCAAELESRYPEHGDSFANRGISGYTLADLHARYEQDVVALNPDLISVLIGTNDVDRHLRNHPDKPFDVEAWERSYRDLLVRYRTAHPSMRLVLCTPFTAEAGRLRGTQNFAERTKYLAACSEVVARLAEEFGAKLVRFDALFEEVATEHPSVAAEHWIWDGIHPTAAGHRLMADRWLEAVTPWWNER